MTRLAGKSALITGAARAIGAAFAAAHVREGATVTIGDINIARAQETAASMGPMPAIKMDVADQASIEGRWRRFSPNTRTAC